MSETNIMVPLKERRQIFKRLSKLSTLGIVLVLAVSTMVGAVLLNGYFNAYQSTEVPTPGTTQPLAIEFGTFGTDSYTFEPMNNLIIPYNEGIISNGEYKEQYYTFRNVNTHDYKVWVNFTNDWFEDPTSEYYGFTYGAIKHPEGTDLNHVEWLIPSGNEIMQYQFKLWYKCDPYFITNTNGSCPVDITIEAAMQL